MKNLTNTNNMKDKNIEYKNIECILGVPVFEYEWWDELDLNLFQFYNVTWLFPVDIAWSKENIDVALWITGEKHGQIQVETRGKEHIDANGRKSYESTALFEGSIMDIKGFRDALSAKIAELNKGD